MQLCLVVVGGEKVKPYRTWAMPMTSAVILIFGTVSALTSDPTIKMLCYLAGATFFLLLTQLMNETIRDSHEGESLCYGSSAIRGAALLVFLTWFPFPVWYALSPEGFNIITNAPLMKIVVAFLNVFSKGTFTLFLMRVRDRERLREKLKAERAARDA